jgi:glucose/arabinose dehydrogenase
MIRKSRLFARLCLNRLEDRTVPATLPTGFSETAVATGLTSATAMEVAPNGDVWVLQQGGIVKRFRPGSTTADVVGSVAPLGLSSVGERGLLGIAFDPQYASNKQVYLYYTATSPNLHNRISRFTVNDSDATDYFLAGTDTTPTDAGSTGTPTQTIIFELDSLSSATNHNGGAIHFGPDGKLYAAVGDNANGANAQTLANLHGKMLRINSDGSIPTDNPFFTTATGAERAIWALGLRNPFTFTFQPGTGRMFINDVGQNTWEEINDGIAGSNYGWPGIEGNQGTPPSGPGTYRGPLYTYSHGSGTFQGFAITGGAFYNPGSVNFPTSFVGDYFFADFVSDWINVLDVPSGNVERFATGALGAVDLRVTADGSLYYLARDASSVLRVRFTATQSPTITQHPQDATVSTGGTASFTVAASGTAPLAYQWQKLNGSTWTNLANGGTVSGATTPTLTITGAQLADAGDYRAVVTNSAGSATSNSARLTVTANQGPTGTITITGGLTNGLFVAGQAVSFSGTGTDPEDGTLGASHFTWRVDYITSIDTGNPVVRPFVPEFSGQTSGTFTPETTGPYTLTDVAYRVVLTVQDSGGLTHTTTVDVAPNTSTLTVTTSPAGLQVTVDGQPFTGPHTFESVVGFERPIGAPSPQTSGGTTYAFSAWSDGGAATHTVSTPASDTTYTATFVPAPATFLPGLKAEFFDFTSSLSVLPNLTTLAPNVVRTDATVNYASTSSAWAGLDSRFANTFATRHTGYLNVPAAGSYTLFVNSDDGSRVWLDGELIIDNNGLHSMRERSATRTLTAGNHTLRTEFFENSGGAGLILSWSGPGIAKQVIPAARLVQDAPNGSRVFRQDPDTNGLVVMEAENFDGNVSQGGKNWTHYAAVAGFSGTGAQQATPNTGVNNDTGFVANSPRLDFRVHFVRTGTHYVWVRGRGISGSDDSVHVGLDGAAVASADRVGSFPTSYTWTRNTMDGVIATINVTTPGVHTVNVWMREDGMIVDKLLLTTNSAFTPTGTGPAESPHTPAALNFGGGFAGAAGLTANGSATISGSAARLTSGGTNEAGSLFSSSRVNVAAFATTFDFQLTSAAADGFAFVIQGAANTALGATGGGLGYQGIGTSAAIKFDLFDNGGEGNNSTGLYTNGAAPTGGATNLTPSGIDLHSGRVFRVTMGYAGNTLSVTTRDLTTGASATQSYTVDLAALVGASTAFVGFTGATGGQTAIQDILNWTYWG